MGGDLSVTQFKMSIKKERKQEVIKSRNKRKKAQIKLRNCINSTLMPS